MTAVVVVIVGFTLVIIVIVGVQMRISWRTRAWEVAPSGLEGTTALPLETSKQQTNRSNENNNNDNNDNNGTDDKNDNNNDNNNDMTITNKKQTNKSID